MRLKLKRIAELTDRNVNLPPALRQLKFKRNMAAAIIMLISIMASAVAKNIGFMMGLLMSAYIYGTALKLNYDFNSGKIEEYTLICLSVTIKRRSITAVFEDEAMETKIFTYPSHRKEFLEDVKYRLYTNKSEPNLIIAYEQI